MRPEIIAFEDRDALMRAAAARMVSELEEAIDATGAACAALSGGSTPEPAYRALAATPLPWPKITFALVDERFVPPTHEASNQRLVQRTLAPAFASGAQLKPMYAAAPTVEEAADVAEAAYAPLHIDVALVGMGGDGHTASWFPGAARLDETLDLSNQRTVMAVRAAQAAGAPERLTLTRAALSRARCVLLLVTGTDRRARLEAALGGDWAPVAALFDPGMPRPEVLWSA